MTNSGPDPIENAELAVTAPDGVMLFRASFKPRNKGTGLGMPSMSWEQPVDLENGAVRVYTFKVQVDKCLPTGPLVLTTAIGQVTGPSITVRCRVFVCSGIRGEGGLWGCGRWSGGLCVSHLVGFDSFPLSLDGWTTAQRGSQEDGQGVLTNTGDLLEEHGVVW